MSEWNRRPCHETVFRDGSTIFLTHSLAHWHWKILISENNIQDVYIYNYIYMYIYVYIYIYTHIFQDQILNHAALLHGFNQAVPTVPMASMARLNGLIMERSVPMGGSSIKNNGRRGGSDLAWPCMEHDLIFSGFCMCLSDQWNFTMCQEECT